MKLRICHLFRILNFLLTTFIPIPKNLVWDNYSQKGSFLLKLRICSGTEKERERKKEQLGFLILSN